MRKWCFGAIVIAMLVVPSFGACPNKCSGHGRCGKYDVCECMQNWAGGDCSGRVCPYTRAWHDTAEGDDDAHYYAECGNRGICDRETGVCECDEPFTGSGCRRLGCPNDCSGHGTCEFIEELAADGYHKRIGGAFGRKYTLWDEEKIMGCRCDPGFEGHNCAKRVCPKGDDPLTIDQYEMMQAIELTADVAGEGFLTYHDPYGHAWVTEKFVVDVLANAADTCADIQAVLRKLPNNVLNTVTVTAVTHYNRFVRDSPTLATGTVDLLTPILGHDGSDADNIGAPTKTICLVEFQSEPGTTGYQNFLECDISAHAETGQHPKSAGAAGTCTVYEHTEAETRPLSELDECSNRGLCDYASGMCKCYTGHMGLACQVQEALV